MSRGRPPLLIGTYGKISTTPEGPSSYRARARFRDADGVTRRVVRYGQTKGRAEAALKAALSSRQRDVQSALVRADSTVAELAELWLAAPSNWAVNTAETYRYVVDNQVKPELGAVRLREVRPSTIARAITRIRDTAGPGAAKTAKTVLAGMFDHAVAQDAMQANPARVKVTITRAKKTVRALTRDEETDLCDRFRTDERAHHYDLPDLVEWMLGTGARIGEACAARDEVLDMEAGTWEINATLIRVKGVGLRIQPRPKTAAGWRRLALPSQCVAIIERRDGEKRLAKGLVLFGAPHGKALRDPSNTAGDLREVLDRIGCPMCEGRGWHASVKAEKQQAKPPSIKVDKNGLLWDEPCPAVPPFAWVHSHVFRKTVATRLDEAGMTSRVIADQLGHAKPSLTQDVYMGRKVVSTDAAKILER